MVVIAQQQTHQDPLSLSLLLYASKYRQNIVGFEVHGHSRVSKAADSYLEELILQLSQLRTLLGFRVSLKATALPSSQHLTMLVLHSSVVMLQPGALAALTQLQHLAVIQSKILSNKDTDGHQLGTAALLPEDSAAAGMRQLLHDLPQLQQLTYLDLGASRALGDNPTAEPGPESYSALTTSSRLQHLDVSNCCLPEGVWQHMFPSDRQLMHLRTLNISWVRHPDADTPWLTLSSIPGTLLARCCPGLQTLWVKGMQYSMGNLSPLGRLSSLQGLALCPRTRAYGMLLWGGGQVVLPRLTGLRELSIVGAGSEAEGLLLQLTVLRALTCLTYIGPLDGADVRLFFLREAPGDEPVWRQVLRCHINHSDLAVAQRASAALAQ